MQDIEETDKENKENSVYVPLPESEMEGLGYTSHSDWGYSGWNDRPSGWTGGGWDY